MSNSTSPLDFVPTNVFKAIQSSWLAFLTVFFNDCISKEVFPSKLKEGIVTPIIKTGKKDSNDFSSYRPVTNLLFIAKLFEKVLASQVYSYLYSTDISDENQSAYRKFYSTETALIATRELFLMHCQKRKLF